jgi:hypothetical protein
MRFTSWMTGAWSSRLISAAMAGHLGLVVGDLERGDQPADVGVGAVHLSR